MSLDRRIRLFDRGGHPLTDIQAVTDIAWELNGRGVCEFSASVADPKNRRHYLKAHNLITVEFEDNKLPAWGGMITADQDWPGGEVKITAYGAMQLLYRRVGAGAYKLTGVPGQIFEQLIAMANSREDTRLRAGEIFYGGAETSQRVNRITRLYDTLLELAGGTGGEFEFVPRYDANGLLYFSANWYERMGADLDFALVEGANIERPTRAIYSERGPIENDLIGYSTAADSNNPATVELVDETSWGEYGLSQAPVSFDADTAGGLEENTRAALAVRAWPARGFSVAALDVGNTFYYCRLGNVGWLRLVSAPWYKDDAFGTEARVRILGMGISSADNKLELVLEEAA